MVAPRDMDDINGVLLTGFCTLTLSAKLVLHSDQYSHLPPEVVQHRLITSIENNSMGLDRTPGRPHSPGFLLGAELARLAKALRDNFADCEDVGEGFIDELGKE